MDDDGRIYSPEASDTQRLGDWQSKFALGILGLIVCASLVTIASCAFAETNRERGMLNMDQAFGPRPAIKLCEVKENGVTRLRTCPKKPAKR